MSLFFREWRLARLGEAIGRTAAELREMDGATVRDLLTVFDELQEREPD